jgi:hypothetical protein
VEKGGKMPIVLELVKFDDIFNQTTNEKIFINEIDIFSSDMKEILDKIITSKYSEDNISLIPSCSCGHTQGAYYIGNLCPVCNTTVKVSVEDNISFLVWLKQPKGIEKLLNPVVCSMLDENFKIGKQPSFHCLRYVMQTSYKVDKRINESCGGANDLLDEYLQKYNIQRGYNSFVQNFDTIVELMFLTCYKFRNRTKKFNFSDEEISQDKSHKIVDFVLSNKDKIFNEYLPFPNRTIFAYETNELGTFIEKDIIGPINVIRRLTGIDISSKRQKVKENMVATSLLDMSLFYREYFKKVVFKNEGLIRQQVISTRAQFSARAVITSISGPHEYNEMHLPWSIACSLFREHLLNRLMKMGYIYRDALSLIISHVEKYNPLLDSIFQEMINEEGNGIAVYFNRNPSLGRGSIQRHRITKIKKDVRDKTISISLLVARAYNADLDGDEMNLTLPISKEVSDNLYYFAPHHNILTLSGVDSFSKNISYPKPIISLLYNWIRSER